MSVTWLDIHGEKGPFFKVLATTERSQTALMTIPPGQEAGPPETHGADQVFYFVEGEAEVRTWAPDRTGRATPGTVIVVPAGVRHWLKAVGPDPLLFLTVYAPPAY